MRLRKGNDVDATAGPAQTATGGASRPALRDLGRARRRAKRAALAVALLGALWLVPAASAAGYDPTATNAEGSADPIPVGDPRFSCPFQYVNAPKGFTPPAGLPDLTECVILAFNAGTFDPDDPTTYFKSPATQSTGVGTLGVAGAPHAAQYIKIPAATSVAVVPIHFLSYFGLPAPPGDPEGTVNVYHFYPRVWFLSADRKRVGEMPPFRVRTLAFGAIPVQVTVHLTQPRNADGTVQPISVEQADVKSASTFPPVDASGRRPNEIYRNAYGKGEVDVSLSDLEVDGQAVDIGDSCRTTGSGSLDLVGQGYYNFGDGSAQPPGTYAGAAGGLLKGTVDIPPFADCGSSGGDDLSPILTNVVSGKGNPISVFQSPTSNSCFPEEVPGACTAGLQPLDVPTTRPQTEAPPAGPVPRPGP